jgi:hypothetical protein
VQACDGASYILYVPMRELLSSGKLARLAATAVDMIILGRMLKLLKRLAAADVAWRHTASTRAKLVE